MIQSVGTPEPRGCLAAARPSGSGVAVVAEISEMAEIGAPADRVWELAGAFDSLDRWMPGVRQVRCTGGGIGGRRTFLIGGHSVEERQTARDDRERSYSYRLEHGPVPVTDYHATIAVTPLDGGRSMVRWSASYQPADGDPLACERLLRRSYRAGLDSLRRTLEGGGRAAG